MISRLLSALSASTTFGSHAGMIDAISVAPALPITKFLRDSSLYS
jgi:hypothetical protein